MQQRRFRPGDVLDDYCPRERRITDHAIVAMIDDHIKQTRCVVCDAEHEYKEGKVPPQRRKRPQAALFSQVLDGLQGPQPTARLAHHADEPDHVSVVPVEPAVVVPQAVAPAGSDNGHHVVATPTPVPSVVITAEPPPSVPAYIAAAAPNNGTDPVNREDGPVRRPLIRATLPRPEGQPVVTRAIPEFTIRQPNAGRAGQRSGRRRGGPQQGQGGGNGPMRFGRGGQGHGQPGQRQQSGRPHRNARRGGKKR
jgi:hypothetical protein